MGYEFACKGVVGGCGAMVSGASELEVLQRAAAHAADAHGMDELPDDLLKEILGAMVWTATPATERRAS